MVENSLIIAAISLTIALALVAISVAALIIQYNRFIITLLETLLLKALLPLEILLQMKHL